MSAALALLKRLALDVYGPECAKCGHVVARPQLDHIEPRSHADLRVLDPDNVQILCPDCNRLKGDTHRDYRRFDSLARALRILYVNALAQEIENQRHMIELLTRAKDKKRGRKQNQD